MKTSLLLIVLIVLNTTAIISEPLNDLIANINTWWFIGLEILLIGSYFIHKIIKDLKSHCEIDCNNLKLYVVKSKQTLK